MNKNTIYYAFRPITDTAGLQIIILYLNH